MSSKKSTKKEQPEPSIEEIFIGTASSGVIAEVLPNADEAAPVFQEPPILHKDILPADEPKIVAPLGRIVYVSGNKYSKAFALQHARDKAAGKVAERQPGCIMLPDGQIITAGPTYETRVSPELMAMAKAGVLQISNFGKLAKRG